MKTDMNILSLGTPLFSSHWRAAGHRVLVVADVPLTAHEDNRPFDFFREPASCAMRIAAITYDFRPDVIFQGDHSTPLIHAGLEEMNVPKAWYAIDTHLHLTWHRHYAALFDRLFCAQQNMVPLMSGYHPNPQWLPVFCRNSSAFMPWAQRNHDVAFVGTLDPARNPRRLELFDSLRQKGVHVHLATGDYSPVYQSSRIVVNQAVHNDLNLRVFEAMGCGSLLVTDRITHSLQELFDEGRDYLAYSSGDADDCAEKIAWALQHPAEAKGMAHSGHAKVLERHCEKHRAAQVLETLQSLAATAPQKTMDPDTRAAHLAWTCDYCSRLALPESLTAFFAGQAELHAARGRTSIQGRPWTLLVSAGQALNKKNIPLANALLSQIAELPPEREFRVRHWELRVKTLLLAGWSAQAREVAGAALKEFPDEKELRVFQYFA
ncbi:MAG: glycosyltransferase family 1 protein [Chitinispirillaceae bacterium]|nr:glycosyltransferase family 1 protein [Chitinispirillaceae bacterium]